MTDNIKAKGVIEHNEPKTKSPTMSIEKMIEEIIECRLDEQQCQQECKHKSDRKKCPEVTIYPKELFEGINRIAKQSTAPDKETPDWMLTDIRRGAKFGYVLSISEAKKDKERIKFLEELVSKMYDEFIGSKEYTSPAVSKDNWEKFKKANNL